MIKRLSMFLVMLSLGGFCVAQQAPYLNPDLPLNARVNDLIGKLTLEEKVHQMMYNSPAIERLDIPPYSWWSESLHGVARSGVATVFPQTIGLGATFDSDLVFRISSAISDEARAIFNASNAQGYHQQYGGLTFWTPNINIFRDPRWGRGQETYGEDPYLTATMGSAFVRGLQGDNPHYLKAAACAKHFAVHSGPERLRHEFNAVASPKDLYETYLPAFKALVDAGVETVMCAYNSTNGAPCCANSVLLQNILRQKWGFKGHIVSDCWALVDIYQGHHTVSTDVEAAALALKTGVNLNCGSTFPALVDAVKQGLVTETQLDSALATLLKTRFRLGLFDPADRVPFNAISMDVVDNEEHRALAREAASKSMVLLKNNGVLPVKNDLARYYVTGPNAADVYSLMGNYYGVNPNMVTILEGIVGAVSPGSQVFYKPGVLLDRENVNPIDWASGDARVSDVTFVVMGINGLLEGEEGEAIASPSYGDRLDYNIPQSQIEYLKKLKSSNPHPVVAIVTGGSPMNLAEVHDLADAVLLVWYPGEEGGEAVADVLFGNVSPSGRLPITFPQSLDQLPPYEDYSMEGRTYRYMTAEPMYPFGFGLSYTSFTYSTPVLKRSTIKRDESTEVTVTVTNRGQREGDEVVELYVRDLKGSARTPLFSLKGMRRVHLGVGESGEVTFSLTAEALGLVLDSGETVVEKGEFEIWLGGSLPGARSESLGAGGAKKAVLTVK